MQKALYLHIGTEKTGSTALQAVSGLNRQVLRTRGILYPNTPGERNQIRLALFAANGPETLNLRKLAGLASDDKYAKFKASFADELRQEVQESACTRIFLSNEHLSSRLDSVRSVGRLAAVICPLADVVKIVVYLRPQPELFLSSYSTAIKAGRIKALQPPTAVYDRRCNYERNLSLWADVFEDKNVIVRIYDRAMLVGGDVIKDFFAIMGYQPGSDIKLPAVVNARLASAEMRFLQEFNRHVPSFVKQSVNPERGDIASALAQKSTTSALRVPASVLRNIADLYADSNAQIARRFLDRSNGKLFEDFKYVDATGPEELTVERAVEIAADLWRWKQRQYLKARREIAMLKGTSPSTKKMQ